MKRVYIVCLFVCILNANNIFSQTAETIDFKDVTFNEALALAKGSNKLVFIDCYTSWCAPCKKMDKTVFVDKSVYSYFNENFVNFKIDMEKGEGIELKTKYGVGSFPTYLFVNSAGEIVHRTASLMPVEDFLREGQTALSPIYSFSAAKEKYEAGDRSNSLLLNYGHSLRKINRTEATKVESELVNKITDEELSSGFGWKVIEQIAMTENDRLGKYLLSHQDYFNDVAGEQAVQTVLNRIKMADMYKLIRDKDGKSFFTNLNVMRKDPNTLTQRNVAMLEMDYYLETNNADSFVVVANKAMNGIIEHSDADLSFVARRALYKSNGDNRVEKQALIMARKAVVLNPEEYSNQGTLGSICLKLKLKDEGLKAAKKARQLADESTSKIQKIAQDLVDKLAAL